VGCGRRRNRPVPLLLYSTHRAWHRQQREGQIGGGCSAGLPSAPPCSLLRGPSHQRSQQLTGSQRCVRGRVGHTLRSRQSQLPQRRLLHWEMTPGPRKSNGPCSSSGRHRPFSFRLGCPLTSLPLTFRLPASGGLPLPCCLLLQFRSRAGGGRALKGSLGSGRLVVGSGGKSLGPLPPAAAVMMTMIPCSSRPQLITPSPATTAASLRLGRQHAACFALVPMT
jgi:hypothetical protein